MTLYKWSTTAADNDDADSTINLRENQAPSTYNNAVRAAMAAAKKFYDDISGKLLTGGSSTAYTLTSNEVLVLEDGLAICARMHATNGESPGLNVDGTGNKPIHSAVSTAVQAGVMLVGSIYEFTYYAATGVWLVKSLSAMAAGGVARPYAAGTKTLFFHTAAPTGWTKDTSLDNGTIRMVSGAVGADGGTAGFTSVLSARTIAQANLPNVNFTVNISSLNTGFFRQQISLQGGPTVVRFFNAEAADDVTKPLAGTATAASGGSGTALDFAVKYADAIRATID